MKRLLNILPALLCLLFGPIRLAAQTFPPIPDNIDADVRHELEILGNPHNSAAMAEAAAIKLGDMGPRASAAIPILIEALQLNWYGGPSTSGLRVTRVITTPSGTYTEHSFSPGGDAVPGACAGMALVKIGEASVNPLIAALDDPRVELRRRSAQVLGMMGIARAAKPLASLLKREQADELQREAGRKKPFLPEIKVGEIKPKDDYEQLRLTVVEALDKIKDPSALPGLILGLADSSRFLVAHKAIVSLSKRGKDAAETLIEALKDENWQIRMNICIVLAYIDDPRFVEPLIAALEKDDDYRVRQQAVIALAKLKAPQCSEVFCTRLNDPDFRVRRELAKQLGDMKDERAVAPLVQLLNRDRVYWKKEFARRMAEQQKRRETSHIEVETAEEEAIRSLGKIGNDKAVAALMAMLSDKKNSYGFRVVPALGDSGNPKAVPLLIKAVPDYPLEAADALRKIGTDKAKDAAVSAYALVLHPPTKGPRYSLENSDQIRAINGLGAIATPKAVQLLVEALGYISLKNRAGVILYELHKTDAKPLVMDELAKALKNPDAEIRAGAASSMSVSGGPKAAELLIPLLNDKSPVVQSRAAEALGRLKDPIAVMPLIDMLNNKDITIQTDADNSLRKITGQDFGNDAAKWQEWWRDNREQVLNKNRVDPK